MERGGGLNLEWGHFRKSDLQTEGCQRWRLSRAFLVFMFQRAKLLVMLSKLDGLIVIDFFLTMFTCSDTDKHQEMSQ